ncbi:MAG: PilZ domain-containing protein [Candidatus Omnitrophica bacterium]|nr:PilZ domain-containing protein [Candidatus Omnitrophota bacterium]
MLRLSEKRCFKRTPIGVTLRYIRPFGRSASGKFSECRAEDISPKGARLFISHNVEVGEDLVVLLNESASKRPIPAKGKVVWAKRHLGRAQKETAGTSVGVEFTHVSSQARYGNKE